ncbi:hypothetical protein, conserved [Eimeria praecox]|uniref:Uncharacterized protein n=1 Tax=Eimeria praecox TaxID=51316 RepID=U6GBV3_9EIME|nr:hypothetical protein, conserved [Eimeria praecox]
MEQLESREGGAQDSSGQQEEVKGAAADLNRAHSAHTDEQERYRIDAGPGATRKNGLRGFVSRKRRAKGEQRAQEVERMDFSHQRDRIVRVVPPADIQPAIAPEKKTTNTGNEALDGKAEVEKGADEAATPPAAQDLCVRIPFSCRRVPVYTEQPRSSATRSAGPRSSGGFLPLIQRLLCCCSTSASEGEPHKQVVHSYICSHILQEAAWRIQEATALTFDPFAEETNQKPSYLLPLSSVGSANSSKSLSFSVRDPEAAKAALLQNPKVALLLDYYERLLVAEVLQLVSRGGRSCSPLASADSSDDLSGLKASSRSSFSLLSTPLFSCLPIAPWHLWWPKESLAAENHCAFRVSVQLLHVSLSECHLFREEDLVAQKLLSAYEVYAYLARCSSGEQLTAKLRSCLQYSKEIRKSCGLPPRLNPLLQAAAAAVAVYRRDQPPQMQQALLLQRLQQMQQLPHQVQQLAGWLASLKADYPQLWKQWLGHMQQRRLLRLQRDQQRQQFAAAGQAIEKLWQHLQHQRDIQHFDCTGLQLELLLLAKEEETEREQLGEEIAAEIEELLTYAVDTTPPQQPPSFDILAVCTAILSKLFASSVPLPGTPVRLLLLSSKEQPQMAEGMRPPASSPAAAVGEAAASGAEPAAAAGGGRSNDASLPLQEQLRRCLCRSLSAVVGCRVNEQSAGGQKHLALHFPFFSTAAAFPIASPIPPENLPQQHRQQLQQQQQQTHNVLASFHTTLNEPLDSVSLHVGISHPGLPKPIEALVAVPLPPQLSAMREELVRSNSMAGEPSTAYHPSPVSFCVDLPFSSFRSNKQQEQQQRHEPQQTAQAEAETAMAFFQQSVSMNSFQEPQAPSVVPLPSFLSAEAAAARDKLLKQQLQQQLLLSTPAWGDPVEADAVDLYLERARAAAAQVVAAAHRRSVAAALAANVRAASAAGVAEAAVAAAEARAAAAADETPTDATDIAAATTRKTPFSAAATRLRAALSRAPHAGNRDLHAPATADRAAADGTSTSSVIDAASAAAGDVVAGEVVEAAAAAGQPSYCSEVQHSACRPDEGSGGQQEGPVSSVSLPLELAGLKVDVTEEGQEGVASAAEQASTASVLPFDVSVFFLVS